MKQEIINEIDKLKKAIKKEKLIFLIGAGISFESPANLTTWPQLSSLKMLTTLDSNEEQLIKDKLRPEIYFQLLYNIIGKRGIFPLEIVNPEEINSKERLAYPNIIHKFLAKILKKGHIVLTTNFDNLIEIAYQELFNEKELKVIIYDEQFQTLLNKKNSLKSGVLIKIHGSFVDPSGNNTHDSIVAILQQLQKEIPYFKRKVLQKLITQYNFVVLGYSGRDDFDLFSFLLKPPDNRKIWWISHIEAIEDKWEILYKNELKRENNRIALIPIAERLSKDWEKLNSNSIVMAYSYGRMIRAKTAEFIKLLKKYEESHKEQDLSLKIEEKTQELLKKWSNSINSAEKNYILSSIFELVEKEYLDQAQSFHDKALESHINLIKAKNLFNKGKIYYKKMGRQNYENSEIELFNALKIFEDLQSISDQADLYLQLLLLRNRFGSANEGISYGEKALNLYLKIDDIEHLSKIVDISWALRGLALVSIKDVPDLPFITKREDKKHCKKVLDKSKELCYLSLKLLQQVGNRTGERGEGQTWNVLE